VRAREWREQIRSLILKDLGEIAECGPLACKMLVEKKDRHLVRVVFFPEKREGIMKNLLKRLWHEEEGQDLTEYALLLVLLTLAAIGSLSTLATAVNGVFANASTALQAT
jgi:Flp pilus assembly pilin Flp